MKSKIICTLTLLLSLFVIFGFTTCVNQDVTSLGTEAFLTGLRIGNIEVTDIALPIAPSEWEDDQFEMYSAPFGRAALTVPNDLIMQRIRPTVSKGARVEWGIASRTTRPGDFFDTRVPITFESDEYIYIKVTSEDDLRVNYYRFYTRLYSWVTDLYRITIAGRQGPAALPGTTYDEAEEALLSIARGEAVNAIVEAETFDSNATVLFAAVTGNGPPGEFLPSNTPLMLHDQDFLYVEVVAENKVTTSIYKYRMNVGRIATIASLKFSDGTEDVEAYGKGLPNARWADVSFGDFDSADQPAAGFEIKIDLDDPDATYEYGLLVTDPNDSDDPGTLPSLGKAPLIRFNGAKANALAVKVTSADFPDVTMFYKVRVNNLPAVIKRHPKPAWYYKGEPAAPLTVELDRQPSGPLPYEYQWYEADSWYGFYGRHGTSLDEKNNLTTVNGGPGQYFYLVEPDKPSSAEPTQLNPNGWWDLGTASAPTYTEPLAWTLHGETRSTYTPRTDWNLIGPGDPKWEFFPGHDTQNNSILKPLAAPDVHPLQGSTYESRYYWVKVTDPNSGLSVTSDRTLIITETDRRMKHYIFDLSLIQKKNIIPFTKTGDLYKVSLKPIWDAYGYDLDPSIFEICIAHAQYFLPDGRPWTQNWTHGDLHFGMDDGSLTWWHNNMGANGGSIPLQAPHSSQGGLGFRPDWIGFAPSGDPEKGIPAVDPLTGKLPRGIYSMSANDPYPAGVAQGYFAGFIELLEIHFSTSPTFD